MPLHPSDALPQARPAHALWLGVHPQTLSVPPPPQVFEPVQPPQSTDCPQLLVSVPQWVPHDWLVATGVQPQMPATVPPPQVWPVPEHVVEHCTVWLQLLLVGPQCPPVQVVAAGSSVQVRQSLPSAEHWLPVQVVLDCVGQLPRPSQMDLSSRTPPVQLCDAQTVVLSKVQALVFDSLQTPAHLPEPAQGLRGVEEKLQVPVEHDSQFPVHLLSQQ